MWLGFFRRKRCSAARMPAKEEGLHQDLSEEAESLDTMKDQQVVYQNEVMQTPKVSSNYSHPSKALATLTRNVTKPFH